MTLTHWLIHRSSGALRRFLERETELLIAVVDSERTVTAHNTAFARLLGNEAPSLVGCSLEDLFRGAPHELPREDDVWHMELRPRNGQLGPLKGVVISDDGSHVLFLRPPGSGDGAAVREMASLNQQLTDLNRQLQKERRLLREANQRIDRMAHTDALTGLPNRRAHDQEMRRAVSAAQRHEQSLSVLMADLDKFKSVNDEYGHEAGDRVLKAFGRLLEESCRAEDVPIRFGGEEFLIIMPQTGPEQALKVAERLRRQWEQAEVPGIDRPTTVSIGVASWHEGEDQEDLVRRADDALYAAKDAGRNCVRSAED